MVPEQAPAPSSPPRGESGPRGGPLLEQETVYSRVLKQEVQYLEDAQDNFEALYLIKLNQESPSMLDGLPRLDFKRVMLAGSNLIKNTGILMKYSSQCIDMGLLIFHRFFNSHSLRHYDLKIYALGALFIGAKTTDNVHRLEKLIKYFYVALRSLIERDSHVNSVSLSPQLFGKIVLELQAAEITILHSFGYQMKRFQKFPHKKMMLLSKTMGLSKEMVQVAWNFANDAYLSSACVYLPNDLIATAAIYLAYLASPSEFPQLPWWVLMEYPLCLVEKAAEAIYDVYEVENASIRGVKRALEKAYRKDKETYFFSHSFEIQFKIQAPQTNNIRSIFYDEKQQSDDRKGRRRGDTERRRSRDRRDGRGKKRSRKDDRRSRDRDRDRKSTRKGRDRRDSRDKKRSKRKVEKRRKGSSSKYKKKEVEKKKKRRQKSESRKSNQSVSSRSQSSRGSSANSKSSEASSREEKKFKKVRKGKSGNRERKEKNKKRKKSYSSSDSGSNSRSSTISRRRDKGKKSKKVKKGKEGGSRSRSRSKDRKSKKLKKESNRSRTVSKEVVKDIETTSDVIKRVPSSKSEEDKEVREENGSKSSKIEKIKTKIQKKEEKPKKLKRKLSIGSNLSDLENLLEQEAAESRSSASNQQKINKFLFLNVRVVIRWFYPSLQCLRSILDPKNLVYSYSKVSFTNFRISIFEDCSLISETVEF